MRAREKSSSWGATPRLPSGARSAVGRTTPRSRRFLWSAALAACLLAQVALAQDGDEPCARPGFSAQLMTPAAGYLPRDGALVVGMFPGGSGPSTLPPGIALTRGRRSIALRSETIAPGLFRLIPETQRLGGSYVLSGVAATPQLLFRRTPLAAPPTAPALERAERYLVASGSERRLEVRAHFGFPIPEDVVAVVSYWGDDATPDAFTRAAPTQRSLVLFTTTGPCDAHPEGTSAPPQTGGRVRVAFVDRHGQLSQISDAQAIE